MTRKIHNAKEIVDMLRKFKKQVTHHPPKDTFRSAGITEVTYYRWRRKYEGMTEAQVQYAIQLQAENARLTRLVADLSLDKRIFEEVTKEILRSPALRRQWVDHVMATLNVTERRACKLLGQHRSTQRKVPKRPPRLLDESARHLLPRPQARSMNGSHRA